MKFGFSVNRSSRRRTMVIGGILSVASIFVFAWSIATAGSPSAREETGWAYVFAALVAPIVFLIGAAGGRVIHVIHTIGDARLSELFRAGGWTHAVRLVAGALAGYCAALATIALDGSAFGPGGVDAVGLLLIPIVFGLFPIWIWLGVVVAGRVTRWPPRVRLIVQSVIATSAMYGLADLFISYVLRRRHAHDFLISCVLAGIAGLVAFLLLLSHRPRSASPSGSTTPT